MRLAPILLLLAAPALGQDLPTFPAGLERVTVDVVVTDRTGRPVTGLTRDDFGVEEDGVVQEILEFQAVDVTAAPDALPSPAPSAARVATNAPRAGPSRHFVVLFDDLGISPLRTAAVRDALRSFVDVQLREGDRVTLAATSGRRSWTGRIAEDRDDLLAFLDTLQGFRAPDMSPERISDVEAMRIHLDRDDEALNHVLLRFAASGALGTLPGIEETGAQNRRLQLDAGRGLVLSAASETWARTLERTRRTLRSIEAAIASLAGGRGRHAVILASDGFVHHRTIDELQRVRDAARRANAAVYFLDARSWSSADLAPVELASLPGDDIRYSALEARYTAEGVAGAEALADDTGGAIIRGDLEMGLRRLSRESRTYYLLGYAPTNRKQDGKFRRIEVRVRRPDVQVRARKGYRAGGKAGPPASDPWREPESLPAFPAVLDESAIPVRSVAYVMGEAGEGRVHVVLTGEADPSGVLLVEEGGRFVGTVESLAFVVARDTGQTATAHRRHQMALEPAVRRRMDTTWIPVAHSFELPPGRYQVALVVRDLAGQRLGSVRQEITVPDLRELRITTPILTDVLMPGREPPVPLPIARRTFTAGTRLHCRFGIAGAPPTTEHILVTYEVRRGDGTLVTGTPPVPLTAGPGGDLAKTFSLTLNRPGRYELVLRARDPLSSEDDVAIESFEVVEAAAP